MEGAAENELHALSGPLPDRNGWDVHSHIDADRHHLPHLRHRTEKCMGFMAFYPKGWEGVAKMENIFCCKYTWSSMGHWWQQKFSRFATTPTTGHRRLDPPYKYSHIKCGKHRVLTPIRLQQ